MPRKKPEVLEDNPTTLYSLAPDRNSPYRKKDPTRASDPKNREAFRSKYGKAAEITDPGKLPKWVLHVLARKLFCDMNWTEAVREEFPRNEKLAIKKRRILDRYKQSPALLKAREEMLSGETDIRTMASEVIAGHAMKIGFLNLKVLKVAEDTGNLPELAKQARWLAENYGMTMPKKSDSAPTHINITLQGGTITAEIPSGDSESTKLLPAEIITDEP